MLTNMTPKPMLKASVNDEADVCLEDEDEVDRLYLTLFKDTLFSNSKDHISTRLTHVLYACYQLNKVHPSS